ncbi:uncharacterized protein TNCV_2414151 [Trichonephila clavipes]|nr:uncharacterized protein TNCV_2414151 [Trichonephila clavipes]
MPLLGMVNLLRGRVFEGSLVGMCALTFDDFDNKDKIIQRIKDVPLSRNTMKDRILKLAENVTDQQKNDINSAPFISLCLDESIDTTQSARLAVFARYCVENIIKEELIAITSLLTTTKGTDICTAKRYYYKKLQVLPKLEKNITDLDAQEKRNEEKVIDDFISIMDSLIKEFSARFSQFKELSETFKFIMYPAVISFDKLNLSQFDWLEIEELEMQLIDFQSSSIWIQKFIETRKKLELIEAERLTSNISKNTSNEILETWNSIPDAFNCLKKLAYAILTIFSSTYACESLFSEINNIKDSLRNRLTDDSNSACILLKISKTNSVTATEDFRHSSPTRELQRTKRAAVARRSSDEAHFWLNGYVNKQNCRICSESNPQVYVETPLHPEKLIFWCALWAGGIIGRYFFKIDEGHNVTVNGDRYRAMITNLFIPELNNHDVQELWFQQDGATCHTARATIDLLKDTFGDRLISRFGPVNWPPRSCDLTPLDYFLWAYVKSLVYADKPQTLDHLEDNIRRVIADIRRQMLEKVIENWTSRLDYIRASRGSHMPEIIFKM